MKGVWKCCLGLSLGLLVGGVVASRAARLLFLAAAGYVANELWHRRGKLGSSVLTTPSTIRWPLTADSGRREMFSHPESRVAMGNCFPYTGADARHRYDH